MGKGIWGIDVSKYSVKAVRLEKGANGGYTLTASQIVPFEGSETGEPGNADEQIKLALQDLKARCKIGGEKVVLSLPGHSTFNRLIKLPPVDDAKLPEVVKYEAQSQIPFNIDEVIWDYQFVQRQYGPGEEKEVILFAIKKDIVEQFLKNIEELGFNVEGVQFGPVALYNFLDYDQDLGGSAIALDMGADNTDLVIIDGPKFWVRNLPITGNDITKALQKAFNIPFGEAEKLKIKAGQSQQAQKIFNAIQPTLRDLVSEVQRSIGYYKSISKASKFDKILLIGNSTKTLNFQKFVSQSLQMPANRIAKMNKIGLAGGVDQGQFNEDLNTVGTAIGLAIQGGGDGQNKINLLPEVYKQRKEIKKKQPWVAGAVAALLLMVVMMGVTANGEVQDLQKTRRGADATKVSLNDARAKIAKARKETLDIKNPKYAAGAATADDAGPLDRLAGIAQERDLVLRVLNLINPNLPNNGDRSLGEEKCLWVLDMRFEEVSAQPIAAAGPPPPPGKVVIKPLLIDKRLIVTIEGCCRSKGSANETVAFVAKTMLGWEVAGKRAEGAKASVIDEFKLRRGDPMKDNLRWEITVKGQTSELLPELVILNGPTGSDNGDKKYDRFQVRLNIPIGPDNRAAMQHLDEMDDFLNAVDGKQVAAVKENWKKWRLELAHTWVMRQPRVVDLDKKINDLKEQK